MRNDIFIRTRQKQSETPLLSETLQNEMHACETRSRQEKRTQTQTFWSGYLREGWGSSPWRGGGQKVRCVIRNPGKPNFLAGYPGYPGGARKRWEEKVCVQFLFPRDRIKNPSYGQHPERDQNEIGTRDEYASFEAMKGQDRVAFQYTLWFSLLERPASWSTSKQDTRLKKRDRHECWSVTEQLPVPVLKGKNIAKI